MPLEKQSLNNFLPDGFETLNQEGYKTNFSEDKIKTGYEKDIKDRVSGPNLNNLIDVVGKNTNTLNNYVEYLNGMPINNVPTTDENGQLNYINLDDKLTKKQITNCILEIPQRIKYTLENGTLTIKAGSVVIVPYGTEAPTYNIGDAIGANGLWKVVDSIYNNQQLFYYAELQQDAPVTVGAGATVQATTVTILPTLNNANFPFLYYTSTNVSSGTEVLSSGGVRYLTNSNLIGRYAYDWSTAEGVGLPICLATGAGVAGGGFASVNQVFNGMGYIGSTVWVDKGVKGLIPNGRNTDGTLKNIEITTDSFKTVTFNIGRTNTLFGIYSNKTLNLLTGGFYDEKDNYIRQSSDNNNIKPFVPFATGSTDSTGRITAFEPKLPFRAVDYNDALLKTDKAEISSWGFPSSKYIDLTFGASLTTYTMQSNGWLYFLGDWNNAKTYIQLENRTRNYKVQTPEISSTGYYGLILPVSKGDVIRVSYLVQPTNVVFRLIYTEGEV